MRTFIQLRNGVGYATVITPEGAPDHSVTPDDTTAIEVFTDNPDQFLKMKYDAETKSWSEAEYIVYADFDHEGRLTDIRRTYFVHETEGKAILTSEVKPDWRWVDGEWVKPYIEAEEVVASITAPYIDPETETEEERLARVAGSKHSH
jgi:hypothetical protein